MFVILVGLIVVAIAFEVVAIVLTRWWPFWVAGVALALAGYILLTRSVFDIKPSWV